MLNNDEVLKLAKIVGLIQHQVADGKTWADLISLNEVLWLGEQLVNLNEENKTILAELTSVYRRWDEAAPL